MQKATRRIRNLLSTKPKLKKRSTGLPPGSVVFTGTRKVDTISIHYLEYAAESYKAQQLDNPSTRDFHQPLPHAVQWYDVRGLHDTELISTFGKTFGVHPLALEDIADPSQRPKLDVYEQGLFLSVKAITFHPETLRIEMEQVSFYLGQGFLLSFQEDAADLFAPVRNRIELSAGRIRKYDADYLLYALLDYLVDQYVVVLDQVEAILETMEADVYGGQTTDIRNELYTLKRQMTRLRKVMVPTRELLSKILTSEAPLIAVQTLPYLQDLRDHQIQVSETTEAYRDGIDSLHDLYLSQLSFRMNNVMQVLAIVSTIFIPLTFFTGLYGMNFEYIPELHYRNGYFILLGVLSVIVLSLIMFFRRKGWL